MAGEIIQDYDAVLKAARRLPPAEQLRLAQELVSDTQIIAFWEEWQRQLIEQGDVASDAEIDVLVAQVRAERRRGKR
jgi:ribosome-binding protein aMBF1 (putative translation factor)